MHDTHVDNDHASWAAEYYKHFGFATRLKNNTQKKEADNQKNSHSLGWHWVFDFSICVFLCGVFDLAMRNSHLDNP